MFGSISDSSLTSWSFWLQCVGIAGALAVVLSLLGMHFVTTEISMRAGRKTDLGTPSVARAASQPVSIALAKPATKPESIPPPKPIPREITEEQRSAFISELTDAPKGALPVIAGEDDPEVRSYADQIRVMLIIAGYDSGSVVGTTTKPGTFPVGIFIVVKNPARAPAFTGPVQNALSKIGIKALGAKDDDFGDDQAAVVVGRKTN